MCGLRNIKPPCVIIEGFPKSLVVYKARHVDLNFVELY